MLINCPECKKSCSDQAGFCINCGFPFHGTIKDLGNSDLKSSASLNESNITIGEMNPSTSNISVDCLVPRPGFVTFLAWAWMIAIPILSFLSYYFVIQQSELGNRDLVSRTEWVNYKIGYISLLLFTVSIAFYLGKRLLWDRSLGMRNVAITWIWLSFVIGIVCDALLYEYTLRKILGPYKAPNVNGLVPSVIFTYLLLRNKSAIA